eukprot:scaffold7932_cov410-Pinguiococcus_pyrenoidosus.AAC.5
MNRRQVFVTARQRSLATHGLLAVGFREEALVEEVLIHVATIKYPSRQAHTGCKALSDDVEVLLESIEEAFEAFAAALLMLVKEAPGSFIQLRRPPPCGPGERGVDGGLDEPFTERLEATHLADQLGLEPFPEELFGLDCFARVRLGLGRAASRSLHGRPIAVHEAHEELTPVRHIQKLQVQVAHGLRRVPL